MSFDKIFDFTTGVYFRYYNSYASFAYGTTQLSGFVPHNVGVLFPCAEQG